MVQGQQDGPLTGRIKHIYVSVLFCNFLYGSDPKENDYEPKTSRL